MTSDAGLDESGADGIALPTEDARALAGVPDGFGRFWTPYRMAYIHGEGKPTDASDRECPFCLAPGKEDAEGLVVYRGSSCFVLMNLFPYNSGHMLVCPYRHVSGGFQPGNEPGRGRRRRNRRASAPARCSSVGGRRELPADHRADESCAGAA